MDQEIRISTLLEKKIPVLQDSTPLLVNIIRHQKYRIATIKKSTICMFVPLLS